MQPDDEELVRDCRSGSQEACRKLFERHHRRVFNVALRLSRSREDARDIAQNVFIKVFTNLESYDPRFRFSTWVARIAVNESLNFIQGRRPQEEVDERQPSGDRGPEEMTGAGEARQVMEKALRMLTMDNRLVVILRHFMDLSYAEISSILDIPEKTVKSRLFSARQMLRDAVVQQGIQSW